MRKSDKMRALLNNPFFYTHARALTNAHTHTHTRDE